MTLSILIPARNEEFLKNTVEDILAHIEGDTEVLVGLDGEWANPPLIQHERVNVLYYPQSIGQRAMTNQLCKLSKAKYVMKVDAHCSFDQGFDVKLMKEMQDDWTMVPVMKNLYAFDWICECGFKHYQDKGSTCPQCKKEMKKSIVWKAKESPNSTAYSFDSTPHFQYMNELKQRKEYQDGIVVGYRLSFNEPRLSFRIVGLLTDLASSHKFLVDSNSSSLRKDMASDAMSLSLVNGGGSVRTPEVFGVRNELKMEGITTSSVLAEMVDDGNVTASTSRNTTNEPGINNPVSHLMFSEIGTVTITEPVDSLSPVPTSRKRINSEVVNQINNILGGEVIYSEKTDSFHNGSVTLCPIYNKDISETMSLQGSCFLLTREKYWELNISDESLGSWGSQGIEVACKTWLSGGRVVCNKKTWYAHMFRTKSANGFGFPYPQDQKQIDGAKEKARTLFFHSKFDKAKRPLSWLVEKFWPITPSEKNPGWTQEALDKLKESESNNVV